MKTRLVKLGVAFYSLCLVASAGSLQAQDTNDGVPPPPPGYSNGMVPQPPGYGGRSGSVVEMPVFDIQIENGQLSLASLKGRAGATNYWASGMPSVEATMENMSKFMHIVDPHLNIVLAPGTGGLVVSDLKLKTSNLTTISQAISVATGDMIIGKVSGLGAGRPVGGAVERMIAFTSQTSAGASTVEVFNLSGYIQTLDTPNENVIAAKLEGLEQLILETVKRLGLRQRGDYSSVKDPDFKFHSGTRLLIVMGPPETIDVCRKIINALPGQPRPGREELLDIRVPQNQK